MKGLKRLAGDSRSDRLLCGMLTDVQVRNYTSKKN